MKDIKEEHIVSKEDYTKMKELVEELMYILDKYRYPVDLAMSPLARVKGKVYDVSYELTAVEHK